MPDITKCTNKECPLSHSCWRFISPPSEYHQAYQRFDPHKRDIGFEPQFYKRNILDRISNEYDCKMYLNKP
jgi:hypothetical protein